MLSIDDYIKLYLDYVNNYLTVQRFAEHYNISEGNAGYMIEMGRKYHICTRRR